MTINPPSVRLSARPSTPRRLSPLGLLCVIGIAGCGGGLKYKVDDSAIDSISSGEKQDVFAAQNDLEVARS